MKKINEELISKKEVVKAVKETIKELQETHKKNLKYRPYAQDIIYAMKAKGSYILNLSEMHALLEANKIKIEQPKDPINDPQPAKLVATK